MCGSAAPETTCKGSKTVNISALETLRVCVCVCVCIYIYTDILELRFVTYPFYDSQILSHIPNLEQLQYLNFFRGI